MAESNRRWKALIIGAGRIGATMDDPNAPYPQTHAHAFSLSQKFELLGFVDPSEISRNEASRRWSVPSWSSVSTSGLTEVDVVAISTPTSLHRETIEEVLRRLKPRLIVLEKPVAGSLVDALAIKAAIDTAGVGCSVNYLRNFEPSLKELAREIHSGGYGALISGTFWYTKGLRNNGSHVLAMLLGMFGKPESFKVLGNREDYSAVDPSYEVRLVFKGGQVIQLVPLDERQYSLWEAAFFFENGRIDIRDFGFRVEKSLRAGKPQFAGYVELEKIPSSSETGLNSAFSFAVEAAAAYLAGSAELASPLSEAIEVEQLLDSIISEAKNTRSS